MREIPRVALVVLSICALAAPLPVMAGSAAPPSRDGLPADPSAPIKIATGADNTEDGYLELSPDEYGSYGAFGIINGITEDLFKPSGQSLQQTTFTSGFFMFVQDQGLRQELLSDIQEWQDILADAPGLSRQVTSASVASDTNGDSVDDTLASSFRIFSDPDTDTDLAFDLVQTAVSLGGGVSQLRQEYTITNDGADPITFVLVRSYDGDLLWDSDFSNDSVGSTQQSAGLGSFIYMEEINIPDDTAVTLSGDSATTYYGGKNGVEPGGGPPPYGFGTDVQVWENSAIPTSWRNNIAGVGYDIDGDSGEFPPGVGDPADGFVGMEWTITLEPGESTTLDVDHTYGQSTPGGCIITAELREQLLAAGDPIRVRVSLVHRRQQTVTVPFVVWLEDTAGNVIVRETTQPYTLQFWTDTPLQPQAADS